jgi:hypothetical protein
VCIGTTTNETTVASIAFCVGKALRRLLEMAGCISSYSFSVPTRLSLSSTFKGSYLLEPIMRIEITCDDKYTGTFIWALFILCSTNACFRGLVLNDLSSQRRGQIASVEVTDGIRFINALGLALLCTNHI